MEGDADPGSGSALLRKWIHITEMYTGTSLNLFLTLFHGECRVSSLQCFCRISGAGVFVQLLLLLYCIICNLLETLRLSY